jgi:hypothetical protein
MMSRTEKHSATPDRTSASLAASIYFSVAVGNPHNRRIVDLRNAVNSNNGEVEFSADFIAVRPKDPQKGNGSMHGQVTGLKSKSVIGINPDRDRDHFGGLIGMTSDSRSG